MRALLFCLLSVLSGLSVAKPLLVVTEDWPPYNFLDKKNQVVGQSTDIVKAILAEAKLDYEIHLFPWARSYQKSLNGKNVLIYTILKTEERAPLFHWFCPIKLNESVFIYQLSDRTTLSIGSLEQAKKYIIGATRGDWNSSFLRQNEFVEGENILLSANDDIVLQLLVHQKVDFMLSSERAMHRRLKRANLPLKTVKKVYQVPAETMSLSCLAMGKQSDPSLVQKIRDAHKAVLARTPRLKSE